MKDKVRYEKSASVVYYCSGCDNKVVSHRHAYCSACLQALAMHAHGREEG